MQHARLEEVIYEPLFISGLKKSFRSMLLKSTSNRQSKQTQTVRSNIQKRSKSIPRNCFIITTENLMQVKSLDTIYDCVCMNMGLTNTVHQFSQKDMIFSRFTSQPCLILIIILKNFFKHRSEEVSLFILRDLGMIEIYLKRFPRSCFQALVSRANRRSSNRCGSSTGPATRTTTSAASSNWSFKTSSWRCRA